MSSLLPKALESVIEQFGKLPGVGPKSATRMAYHYLRATNGEALALSNALQKMDSEVISCTKCFNATDKVICGICDNQLRDGSKLCLVEEPLDVVAIENSGIFNGLYFVLGGVISPADGVGADELRFGDLERRLKELLNDLAPDMKLELIVATNPSLEGEATADYVKDMVNSMESKEKIEVTRLAMGLPTGADLEYADRLTLKRALDGRRGI